MDCLLRRRLSGFDNQAQSRTQFGEELESFIQRLGYLIKGWNLAIERAEDSVQSIHGCFDFCLCWRGLQRGIQGPEDSHAAHVKIQVGQLKREALVVAIGRVIERPLRIGAPSRNSGTSLGEEVL